jgi:hypothetical protein
MSTKPHRKSGLLGPKVLKQTTQRYIITRGNSSESSIQSATVDDSGRSPQSFSQVPPGTYLKALDFVVIGGYDNGSLPIIKYSTKKHKTPVRDGDIVVAVDGIPCLAAPLQVINDIITTVDPLVIDVARAIKSKLLALIYCGFLLVSITVRLPFALDTEVSYYLSRTFASESFIETRIREELLSNHVFCQLLSSLRGECCRVM